MVVVNESSPVGKTKKLSTFTKTSIVLLLFIFLAVAGIIIYKHLNMPKLSKIELASQEKSDANAALTKGDNKQALTYAKMALKDQPNNLSNIMLVANLENANNPSEAHYYYNLALNLYQQQNPISSSNTKAVNYWVLAHLAQQVGNTSLAKQYYQDVINTANPSISFEQSIALKSQSEIKDLQ